MLTNFVSIYVPGTLGLDDRKLTQQEREHWTQATARKLSAKFGGATATPSTGYYVADNGQLVEESVTIVKSYYSDSPDALDFAESVAKWIKSELGQELVSIETEQGLAFV